MKKFRNVLLILIILAIVIVVPSCLYTTQENEFSVVKQFGKIVATTDVAGLHTKIPFVQTVNSVTKATQIYDLPASEVITSDKKTMIVDAYVLWGVKDVKLYTQSLNSSAQIAQGRIDVIVYNAIKTTISSMTQDELIASRDTAMKISTTEATIDDIEINDIVSEDTNPEATNPSKPSDIIVISDMLINCIGDQCKQYGIEISDVKIKVLDLPDENKEAVYERMISERNNIAASYKASGEAEAKKIRSETDKQVTITVSEAKAQAEQIIAEGEAEYMQILSSVYNTPEKADFYTFVLALDAVEASFKGGNKTVILTKDSPIASILYSVEE